MNTKKKGSDEQMANNGFGDWFSRNAGTISTACLVGSIILQAASSLASKTESKRANQLYIHEEVKNQLPHLLNK